MRASTLVLFDWDDTLFPTTSCTKDGLIRNGGLRGWRLDQVSPNFDQHKYARIGHLVHSILVHFIKAYGSNNVSIVTNGSDQWVQHSLRHLSYLFGGRRNVFLDILLLLQTHDITIISAQHEWRNKVHNINEWKYNAFKGIIDSKLDWKRSAYFKFITIGDRETDHDSVTKCIENTDFQQKVQRYNVFIKHERFKMVQRASLHEFEQQMLSLEDESYKTPKAEFITKRYRNKMQTQQNKIKKKQKQYFTRDYRKSLMI